MGWRPAIQPIFGYVDPYLDALPANAAPRLHHVARRRDNPLAMRRDSESLSLPIAFEGTSVGVGYVFVDARARLGHFLEFVTATDAGWEMLGRPNG